MFWTVFLRFVQTWQCFGLHLSFKHTETVFPKKVRVKCIFPTTLSYQILWSNSLLSITDNFNSLSCSEFSSKSYFSKIKKILFLKENQLFCTTATKEILPSTTFWWIRCWPFALYVLLNNFCSWKIVVKKPHSTKSPAQRNLHALYHVNVVANYRMCAHQPTS